MRRLNLSPETSSSSPLITRDILARLFEIQEGISPPIDPASILDKCVKAYQLLNHSSLQQQVPF